MPLPRSANVLSSASPPVSGSPSSPIRRKPFSDRLQPMSRARSRRRTLCSFEPVKWMRYVPAAPGGITIRSTCGPRQGAHCGLVPALVEHLIDDPKTGEALDEPGSVVGLGEQVEVADALALSSERAGRFDGADAGRVGKGFDEPEDRRLGAMEQHPLRRRLETPDALEDQRLGPVAQTLQRADAALLGGRAEAVDRHDAELDPDLADRTWTEPRDPQQLDEARRDLGDRACRSRPSGLS